jgi:hypothetical protein
VRTFYERYFGGPVNSVARSEWEAVNEAGICDEPCPTDISESPGGGTGSRDLRNRASDAAFVGSQGWKEFVAMMVAGKKRLW